jgi:hypothetical protein
VEDPCWYIVEIDSGDFQSSFDTWVNTIERAHRYYETQTPRVLPLAKDGRVIFLDECDLTVSDISWLGSMSEIAELRSANQSDYMDAMTSSDY